LSPKEKQGHVDKSVDGLSLNKQCQLLGIHRSRVYYKPQACVEDVVLMNEIREIWLSHPYYGYRRIREALVRRGHHINRKCVARLMRIMNLEALYPKPKTSIRNRDETIYPYLLEDLAISRVNQAWCIDITYIPMRQGFVYLVAIIDVYSRYIMGWNLATTLETENCLMALEKALKQAIPEIVNSDQGCQFTSDAWIKALCDRGIQASMDSKGRCLDNIFIERFWRSLKQEDVYLKAYENVAEARVSIGAYIAFYNQRRPHQSLNYLTPAEVYFGCEKNSDFLLGIPARFTTAHQINRNIMLPI
jgi:putative transposase